MIDAIEIVGKYLFGEEWTGTEAIARHGLCELTNKMLHNCPVGEPAQTKTQRREEIAARDRYIQAARGLIEAILAPGKIQSFALRNNVAKSPSIENHGAGWVLSYR
jgi:hypothetical protein